MAEDIREESKWETWLKNAKYTLSHISDTSQIKTNFFKVEKNVEYDESFMNNLIEFLKYLRELISIEYITEQVLEHISTDKLALPIRHDIDINILNKITHKSKTYGIKRLDKYNVEITLVGEVNWNVDRLMVQVKNHEGIIVSPVVQTKNSTINLYFSDGIGSNYTVLIL